MNADNLVEYLKCVKDIMADQRDYLIDLDSVVGDGDLGLTMSDGFAAAYEAMCRAVEESGECDGGRLLYGAGKAMAAAVPSTMGTLMASGLMESGKAMKGKMDLTTQDLADLFKAYQSGVENRGKARGGDKTFLDGLAPAVDCMYKGIEEGLSQKDIMIQAAAAAKEGFEGTTKMIARHGRAATRGEASRILLDPGAAVAMFLMEAAMTVFQSAY